MCNISMCTMQINKVSLKPIAYYLLTTCMTFLDSCKYVYLNVLRTCGLDSLT